MSRPLEVHLLRGLQGVDGAVNGPTQRILVLVVAELQDMAALSVVLRKARLAVEYRRGDCDGRSSPIVECQLRLAPSPSARLAP